VRAISSSSSGGAGALSVAERPGSRKKLCVPPGRSLTRPLDVH
jgi:hypothetical protein